MLLKECARCKRLINYGRTYCKTCAPIVEKEIAEHKRKKALERQKKYNKTRDPKYTRFYNSIEWTTLSKVYAMHKRYRCERCGRIGVDVHHIKPIQTSEGWERRLDETNLELLCVSCHNERHNRFKKAKDIKKDVNKIKIL